MDRYTYKGSEEPSVASIKISPTAQSLAAELQNPAAPGDRHSQIKRTVIPMIELGLCDAVIFTQYRQMYDADLPDSEIGALIKWARDKVGKTGPDPYRNPPQKKTEYTPQQKLQNALDWLKGFQIHPVDLWEQSQVKDEDDSDALLYLALFQPADLVNINTRYIMRQQKDGSQKAELCGAGETHFTSDWIENIHRDGIPESRAGAWIRINPLRSIHGEGAGGAHTDADVSRYARVLLETDDLPYNVALSLLAKAPVSMCAIVDSAGRGPHGIAVVDAFNAVEYALKARAIFKALEPLGIDPGNSNPSRYSRLPGARRIIGARAECSVQRLLYMASNPRTGGIFV